MQKQKQQRGRAGHPDRSYGNKRSYGPSSMPGDLPRSTRDWETERHDRLRDLNSLPLISRSGASLDKTDPAIQDLRKRDLQNALWGVILDEFHSENYVHAVELCRKLREGMVASNWSQGDYTFCIRVFELSVKCAIKANNHQELWKSLRGLVDELYNLQTSKDAYYKALDILYLACCKNELLAAREKAAGLDNSFIGRVTYSLWYGNPLEFFSLYATADDIYIRILMQHSVERMRSLAVAKMTKVYYTVPVDWAARWLGTNEASETIAQFQRLAPDSVGSVQDNVIRLVRRPAVANKR